MDRGAENLMAPAQKKCDVIARNGEKKVTAGWSQLDIQSRQRGLRTGAATAAPTCGSRAEAAP